MVNWEGVEWVTVIDKRMAMFWYKLANSKHSKLSSIVYRLTRALYDKGIYQSAWLTTLVSYLWNTDLEMVNRSWLKNTIVQKLADIFRQQWNTEVNAKSSCTNYRIFKTVWRISHNPQPTRLYQTVDLDVIIVKYRSLQGVTTEDILKTYSPSPLIKQRNKQTKQKASLIIILNIY